MSLNIVRKGPEASSAGKCKVLVINLSPITATNDVISDHTVTALVQREGTPAPDALVSFEVTSGPNAGLVSITFFTIPT